MNEDDYQGWDILTKAMEHIDYGNGKHIPLGEPIKNPINKQKNYLDKVFKTKSNAVKFMNKELSKKKYYE